MRMPGTDLLSEGETIGLLVQNESDIKMYNRLYKVQRIRPNGTMVLKEKALLGKTNDSVQGVPV